MRKDVKRKSLNEMRVLVAATSELSEMGRIPPPPAVRKSGNCRTYGIRNLEEGTENEMQESKGLGECQVDGDTR